MWCLYINRNADNNTKLKVGMRDWSEVKGEQREGCVVEERRRKRVRGRGGEMPKPWTCEGKRKIGKARQGKARQGKAR